MDSIMQKLLPLLALVMLSSIFPGFQSVGLSQTDSRCYELRIYFVADGKMEDLHNRFRNHTLRLFQKHSIESVGYWVPLDPADNTVYFLLRYPNREAREKAWGAFMKDPDWQSAMKASEANGKLVNKADVKFLKATDYSSAVKIADSGKKQVFELRTYTSSPGNLEALNSRFRDHTVSLFAKHGMRNFGYWVPMDAAQGGDNTLIYLLAHDSKDAAGQSFKSFGGDPAWDVARKASEAKAGGSLTAPNGVKSLFLKPTDYSPTK